MGTGSLLHGTGLGLIDTESAPGPFEEGGADSDDGAAAVGVGPVGDDSLSLQADTARAAIEMKAMT
ncbi:MAG TPA: hypothetical protein VIK60_08460 [Vicinamibacterales bacterium]